MTLITSLTWAVVEVDLIRSGAEKSPRGRLERDAWPRVYRDARIDFDSEKSSALHISPSGGSGCSVFEAKLFSLSPYRISFTAVWPLSQNRGDARACPVSVEARFEDVDRWDIERERQAMQMILDYARRGPIRPVRDPRSGVISLKAESESVKAKKPVGKRRVR